MKTNWRHQRWFSLTGRRQWSWHCTCHPVGSLPVTRQRKDDCCQTHRMSTTSWDLRARQQRPGQSRTQRQSTTPICISDSRHAILQEYLTTQTGATPDQIKSIASWLKGVTKSMCCFPGSKIPRYDHGTLVQYNYPDTITTVTCLHVCILSQS